ncbi:MAG: hypothetical protein SFU98_04870 [Leptospiraceae bacterium]|nr:hypothetical protein [Leptospiraceae bacterium]
MFLFTPPVAGAIFFAIGLYLFLKFFFNLDQKFYKPFFTLLLIVLGLNVVLSDFKFGSGPESNTAIFKESVLPVVDPNAEYNVMFTRSTTDFTGLPVGGGNTFIDSNTIFAKNIIEIKADVPTRILIYPTLGLVKLPNGIRIIPLFKNIYTNKVFKNDSKAITIKINIVFGAVEIIEK